MVRIRQASIMRLSSVEEKEKKKKVGRKEEDGGEEERRGERSKQSISDDCRYPNTRSSGYYIGLIINQI